MYPLNYIQRITTIMIVMKLEKKNVYLLNYMQIKHICWDGSEDDDTKQKDEESDEGSCNSVKEFLCDADDCIRAESLLLENLRSSKFVPVDRGAHPGKSGGFGRGRAGHFPPLVVGAGRGGWVWRDARASTGDNLSHMKREERWESPLMQMVRSWELLLGRGQTMASVCQKSMVRAGKEGRLSRRGAVLRVLKRKDTSLRRIKGKGVLSDL